ncbi:MAG: hypothetical protein WDN08_19785 [Rhizomicrobium sp.]
MSTAGWLDVWHLAVAIVVRQPPFLQIMYATGAVFLVVMAVEGVRTSLLSIWRAHRQGAIAPPPPPRVTAHAMPGPSPFPKNISALSQTRFNAVPVRRPKALTLSPRQFRSPRPKIQRHPRLDYASFADLPENAALTAFETRDAL